jgi:hypothetical protein
MSNHWETPKQKERLLKVIFGIVMIVISAAAAYLMNS